MSDILVFTPRTDRPTLPNPWSRLPAALAALVADPREWGTFTSAAGSKGTWEEVAAAASEGRVQIAPAVEIAAPPRLPELAPREQSLPEWKQALVDRAGALLGLPVRSNVDLIALQAGILQVGDHLTPSHEHSQSIEGRGKRQAGDYWHAINHRREPDDGNAKYWFRHVGNHPVLAEIGPIIGGLVDEFPPEVREKGGAILSGSRLDPFRLVDLASEARRRRDSQLTTFVERVQWIEMVHLLESTLKDAAG